ncbi:MAG: serine/threonine protein kinase [Acidobacteriaceae bacterium]|nr:serine/threonine protein kinase [Acidobacteriaceae bacterium]MBV9296404.1 serine/threonine protein kinase [Acidobacteriaceae bacterium]MBV9764384.1 serine/threonine protein kinase [Acidobacteriaceae bacterium]
MLLNEKPTEYLRRLAELPRHVVMSAKAFAAEEPITGSDWNTSEFGSSEDSTERVPSVLFGQQQWRIVEQIGAGSMGKVFSGYEVRNGPKRKVAVKTVNSLDQTFANELHALTTLTHPNIADLYDFGTFSNDGNAYGFLVMKFVEGETLETLFKQQGKIPLDRWYFMLKQICSALQHAHENSFLHRDLKPANIMVGKHDAVTLVDFGVCKPVNEPELEMATGTPLYWAPESLSNPTAKSDIYALGVICYEALMGEHPLSKTVRTEDLEDALAAIQFYPPPPCLPIDTLEHAKESPEKTRMLLFARLVHRAMAKDPENRPRSPEDFMKAWESIQNARSDQLTIPATPDQLTVLLDEAKQLDEKVDELYSELCHATSESDFNRVLSISKELESIENKGETSSKITDLRREIDGAVRRYARQLAKEGDYTNAYNITNQVMRRSPSHSSVFAFHRELLPMAEAAKASTQIAAHAYADAKKHIEEGMRYGGTLELLRLSDYIELREQEDNIQLDNATKLLKEAEAARHQHRYEESALWYDAYSDFCGGDDLARAESEHVRSLHRMFEEEANAVLHTLAEGKLDRARELLDSLKAVHIHHPVCGVLDALLALRQTGQTAQGPASLAEALSDWRALRFFWKDHPYLGEIVLGVRDSPARAARQVVLEGRRRQLNLYVAMEEYRLASDVLARILLESDPDSDLQEKAEVVSAGLNSQPTFENALTSAWAARETGQYSKSLELLCSSEFSERRLARRLRAENLYSLAENDIEAGQLPSAEQRVTDGLAIAPNHPRLLQLKKKVKRALLEQLVTRIREHSRERGSNES